MDLEQRLAPENERLELLTIILRDFLMDKEEVNHLIEGEEFSDQKLRSCLLLSLDYYNSCIQPREVSATVMTFPSLSLWLEGAAIYALKSKIFSYIRNAFMYNDAGVQVSVEEKAAEYERTVQRMLGEYIKTAQNIKENINLTACVGSFSSEYLQLYIIGRRNISRKI